MRGFLCLAAAVLAAFLIASAAHALSPRQALLLQSPAIPAPDLVVDCANGDPSSLLTVTRAGNQLVDNTAGIWTSFGTNTLPRTNKGCYSDAAITNFAKQSRDLTQAVWTKTNATAALTQTGIDNTANAATLLTATANAGTVTQAITDTSRARVTSAFVKRSAGTGNVYMTQDGGSTWTQIQPCAASVFIGLCRVWVGPQTVTNPTIGFKFDVFGDAVIVDAVQNEGGSYPTMPVLTTTAAVARPLSVILLTTLPTFTTTISGICSATFTAPVNSSINQTLGEISDNTANNTFTFFRHTTDGVLRFSYVGSGTVATGNGQLAGQNQSGLAGGTNVLSPALFMVSAGGQIISVGSEATVPSGLNRFQFGGGRSGASPLEGYLRVCRYWLKPPGLTPAQLAQAARQGSW